MQLQDITFPIGSVNPSGISDEVYFVPKQYIQTWPTIQDDFETAEDVAEYANLEGSFVLKDGKKWNRLYSTQGKGKISWEYQGETDCKVVVNKATLSYPKLNDQGRALAKYASNGDFVFIVKHDGQFSSSAAKTTAPPSRPTATPATLLAPQRVSRSKSNALAPPRCRSTRAPSRSATAPSTARRASSRPVTLPT